MNEIEKVAVLLIALGPEHSKRILDRLGPDDLIPIVQAMKRLNKVSPDQRASVLEEVNGILEDLAAQSLSESGFDPASPEPEIPLPELPDSPSARDIIQQVHDELPERIESDSLPDIDWGAAGFDFGSGNRGKRDDEDPPTEKGGRQ